MRRDQEVPYWSASACRLARKVGNLGTLFQHLDSIAKELDLSAIVQNDDNR